MPAPRLVLGPLLRHVGEEHATVWVEADRPCEVEVLGARARTFHVAGHHYAIVAARGLPSGATLPYEVRLDGVRCWPEPGSPFPPSVVRTRRPGDPSARLAFGSCRVALPHEPPFALSKDDDPRGREVDALIALSRRLATAPHDTWPDLLLLLGDQVYADEVDPATQRLIERRRAEDATEADDPPAGEVADFEEYTSLYREAWGDPPIRWLLSTVGSAMVFDDHDVKDDWNTSAAWCHEMRQQPWWPPRIVGAYMSYWVHQHLGNLSPDELDGDPTLRDVLAARDDAEPVLRAFAERAEAEVAGTRWSYHRDLGPVRLVVVDSRAGRMLGEGERSMLSDGEWAWLEEAVAGDADHLVVATTLPWLLSPGLHHLEAWNEAVCAGAWGRRAARLGERVRQGLDLEHWSAFHRSFRRLAELLHDVAAGRRGAAPASIVVLSGDVHHAYVAEVSFPAGPPVRSAVVQAVCSPIRNPLDRRERRMLRVALSRPAAAAARALARAAGVRPAPIAWRFTGDPTFDNQVGLLELDGRSARVAIERTRPEDWRAPVLHRTLDHPIA